MATRERGERESAFSIYVTTVNFLFCRKRMQGHSVNQAVNFFQESSGRLVHFQRGQERHALPCTSSISCKIRMKMHH